MRIFTKVENKSKAERERWHLLAKSQKETVSGLIRKLIEGEMAKKAAA